MSLFKKEIADDLVSIDEKPQKVKQEKKGGSKLPLIGVVAVVAVVVIFIAMKMLGSGNSGLDYYGTMNSIFSNELGSFNYILTVETGAKGTLIKDGQSNLDLSIGELNEAGNADDGDSDSSEGDRWNEIAIQDGDSLRQDKEFADWDKYAEVKIQSWDYPVYQVRIEGCTMSIDPLLTDFTVTVATRNYNDKFTEVVVRDGIYYFDVESMYNWLINSADDYLISLAKEIPHGSKWLTVPESEFAIASRYAEEGDEQSLSECTDLVTMYRRGLVLFQTIWNSMGGYLGDRGLTTQNEVTYLNLAGDDAAMLVDVAKNLCGRSGDFYNSLLSSGSSLYSESQMKQAIRERDNFVTALSDLHTALQVCDASALGIKASGQVRSYTNGYGNSQIEGVLGIQFSTDTIDYVLKFNGMRNGNQKDIVLPAGSQTTSYKERYLSAFYDVVDYFNFTPIRTSVQLSLNPDTIKEHVLEQFIELVNNTGTAGYRVVRGNVEDFIAQYKDLDPQQAENENDMINARLVKDLREALAETFGGVADTNTTNPTEPNEPVDEERYPAISCEIEGATFSMHYNGTDSNRNMVVLDVEALNKSDEDIVLNCTDFNLKTLLGSMYPANNQTLIRGANSTFDMDLLEEEITIPAKGWYSFKLYFVLSDDRGHTNAFYNDQQLGVVIQY